MSHPEQAHASRAPVAELFLISALILFLELACIRWFPAHVLFLTFFTNTVLLACFLGMSLGCLAAGHGRDYLKQTPLVLAGALIAAYGVTALRDQMERIVDVGNQASPQLIFFGTEYYKGGNPDRFVLPIEVVEGVFFLLIALSMVGPGQQLGRSLTRISHRVQAYTVNILGSVAGIVLFALCSWLHLSPGWWFLGVAVGLGYFLFQRPLGASRWVTGVLLAAIVGLPAAASVGSAEREQYWSPYYRIDFAHQDNRIVVNLIGHQKIVSRETNFPAYALPHMLNRDAGGSPFQNVMIIGAGSGNDVSRSVQWGARHVDAVEIDPVIRALGARHNPDQPYADAQRVTAHLADGRNFLRSARRDYDVVIYALVDSLVLHSSYSNIRLESYLFTKEAFADVKRCLKDDGLFVMYNVFRQGWLVARLQKTLKDVFGAEPLVFALPYSATIEPEKSKRGFTFFVAGREQALAPLRRAFASLDPRNPLYWIDLKRAPSPSSPNGFVRGPSAENPQAWLRVGLADVKQPTDELMIATDDWPFLYLRNPMIPDLNLRGAAIMAGLALLLLAWFVPPRHPHDAGGWRQEAARVLQFWIKRPAGGTASGSFDARMFFLGAGFMLIETKAVVHMALVFGSTWMVNSVVFLAVLVMILLANLFVLKVQPRQLWPYYAGLFVALSLNVAVPLNFFLGWPIAMQMIGSCLLVFAPVLFAGVLFAVSFARTAEPDRAFGFNIAGAMLGGLAEYSSMLVGFRQLLLVALVLYLLSALPRRLRHAA